ncbi:MAG: VacB/RNase II family 3'-5' exoribonuclease [Planctomycetota bacterium]
MSDGSTTDQLRQSILKRVSAEGYTPMRPRQLAAAIAQAHGNPSEGIPDYGTFRGALRDLMDDGDVVLGSGGAVLIPASRIANNELVGSYRSHPKGFGFVIPQEPDSHEDLFIPPGDELGAMSGDIVRAKIIPAGYRNGKDMYEGSVLEIIERRETRFVGTVGKLEGKWFVFPDGKRGPEPIAVPDAGSRYVEPGQKVIVEVTRFADDRRGPEGVISQVLGDPSDKDVDLRSAIVQFGLPEEWPKDVLDAAGDAVRSFDPETEKAKRLDLTNELICTIDPDDAKDYDDAISLSRESDGTWKLGVHIADVSYFVKAGGALDQEAYSRGNSTYFPGHVIPMLPEVLSNGVCSLVEGEPRLVKSAFIWLDPKTGRPRRTAFANSVIHSFARLRYIEAQDLIDGKDDIYHTDGPKKRSDYDPKLIQQLEDMNTCAKLIQKRRQADGQIVLNMPSIELELDAQGKVVGAAEEDDSFTHTLIEMFMVEANEAVARLFAGMGVPHIRRIHPGPDGEGEARLKTFAMSAGYRIPDLVDRHAIQALLANVRGKPEEFAVNLAVLRSISQAEYSPKLIGHFALASEHYSHFTSPIRRYADLMVHRLMDRYFEVMSADFDQGPVSPPPGDQKVSVSQKMSDVPSDEELDDIGSYISYTERRSESAERELRSVKVLQLLADKHVGDEFNGVVTGITNFGLFVQLETYLAEGLVRYQDLLDDWWDVDAKAGVIRGKRTNTVIRIGDVVQTKIARVDVPKRELDIVVLNVQSRGTGGTGKSKAQERQQNAKPRHDYGGGLEPRGRTGGDKRSQRSKSRDTRGKNRGKWDKRK